MWSLETKTRTILKNGQASKKINILLHLPNERKLTRAVLWVCFRPMKVQCSCEMLICAAFWEENRKNKKNRRDSLRDGRRTNFQPSFFNDWRRGEETSCRRHVGVWTRKRKIWEMDDVWGGSRFSWWSWRETLLPFDFNHISFSLAEQALVALLSRLIWTYFSWHRPQSTSL